MQFPSWSLSFTMSVVSVHYTVLSVHLCPVLHLSVHLSSLLLCSPLSSPSLVCPLVKSFAFSHLSCPSLVCPLVKSFTLFTSVQSFTCLSTCQVICFFTPVLSFTCLSACQVLCFVHVCRVFHLSVHLSSPPAHLYCLSSSSCLSIPSFVCPFAGPSHCSCLLLSPCFRKQSKTQQQKSSSSSLEARLLQCCIFLHILIQTGCLTPVTACLPVLPPLGRGHDLSMQYKR